MSNRIKTTQKYGLDILILDYSNLKGDEFVTELRNTTNFILSQPQGYNFDVTISDNTGSRMNDDVKKALKEMDEAMIRHFGADYKENNKDSMAIPIGISGIQKIIAGFMIRDVKFVNTFDEAYNYIQKNHPKVKKAS